MGGFQYNCTKELFASKLSRNKVVAGEWMTLDELVELMGNPQKDDKEIVANKCP